MVELGIGAGQIGLAAAALGTSSVVQVDRSPAAFEWATHNANMNGLADRVEPRLGLAGAVVDEAERFAVVVADPPYIATAETDRFPDDPMTAIDGGDDGMVVVRDFLLSARRHLSPGGCVILQVAGSGQINSVDQWLGEAGAPDLEVVESRSYGADRALARLMAP